MARRMSVGSVVPHISRAECMLNCATPASAVGIPSRADARGPMVDPHGTLLRLTNVCQGTPAASHERPKRAAVSGDVA